MATLKGTSLNDTLKGGSGNDIIYGLAGIDHLYGYAGVDILYGATGNDVLDGGTGNDRMYGSTGNDTYIVNSSADRAIELAGEGTDTVKATSSFTLGANVEHLTLVGTYDRNGTGNSLSNKITGNSGDNDLYGLGGTDSLYGGAGNDVLDGGTGNDRMYGNTGNDTYFVNSAGDQAIELAGQGIDTVKSAINFSLGANVEHLTLLGSLGINGYGNALGNTITGNDGGNELYGNAGNDVLMGGAGNDFLAGGTGADTLNGGAGEIDLVSYETSPTGVIVDLYDTFTATDGFGFIDTLIGIEGVGGSIYGDVIWGGAADEVLLAGAGDDFIDAGGGSDWMDGGFGLDFFAYSWDSFDGSIDVITNYNYFDDSLDLSNVLDILEPVDNYLTYALDGAGGQSLYIDFDGSAGGTNFTPFVQVSNYQDVVSVYVDGAYYDV